MRGATVGLVLMGSLIGAESWADPQCSTLGDQVLEVSALKTRDGIFLIEMSDRHLLKKMLPMMLKSKTVSADRLQKPHVLAAVLVGSDRSSRGTLVQDVLNRCQSLGAGGLLIQARLTADQQQAFCAGVATAVRDETKRLQRTRKLIDRRNDRIAKRRAKSSPEAVQDWRLEVEKMELRFVEEYERVIPLLDYYRSRCQR